MQILSVVGAGALEAVELLVIAGGAGGGYRGGGRKPIQIDESRAFSLHDQGFSKRVIADRFGVPYKSLLTIFRKAGKFKETTKRKPNGT